MGSMVNCSVMLRGLSYFSNGSVFQLVRLAALFALGGTAGVELQLVAKLAHPASLAGGVAHHQRIGRDRLRNHGSGADKGKGADLVAAHDGGIGADRGPAA